MISNRRRAKLPDLEKYGKGNKFSKTIRCDNGPEFISKTLAELLKKEKERAMFTKPRKPMQNGYMERLNRIYREDELAVYWFNDLQQPRSLSKNG